MINISKKKIKEDFHDFFSELTYKHLMSFCVILILSVYFIFNQNLLNSKQWIEGQKIELEKLNIELEHLYDANIDSLIRKRQNAVLLSKINDNLGSYLYKLPDYSYINILHNYFAYVPDMIDDIPSIVPLEKGNYQLSSNYGTRYHPIHHKFKKHAGIDLAGPEGKKVYASANGVVLKVEKKQTGYGYHIIIQHRFGFKTLYAHLSKILVVKGQRINQNDLIGLIGSTGGSTGPHLHYEIEKNNKKIDPKLSFNLKKNVYKNMYAHKFN